MIDHEKMEIITSVAEDARAKFVPKVEEQAAPGICIDASDYIVERLSEKGIEAKAIEGWMTYEDEEYGTDRPYDEHTWVEVGELMIDVTIDQFQGGCYTKLPAIYIGDKHEFLTYSEPELDEDGFLMR